MRLYVFGCRPYDEEAIFRRLALEYHLEIGLTPAQLTKDNMEYYIPMLRGYDAVSVVATPIHFELLEAMHEAGVRLLSTRTIGYDHIDMAAAKALGFTVCNAGYGPDAVADYTVMLMLMALRNAKRVIQRADLHDFSMPGLMGRQLRSCTVGILGAGRIGARVMEELRGFGCRVIYWSRTSRPGLAGAQVSLETLYRESDIISLHMPLTPETQHIISRDAMEKMKPGVILVNTARGGLVDTQALIDALETGKVGGAALDVVEGEAGLYHFNKMSDQIGNRALSILKDMPNVVFTPHMAFYTGEAVEEMARCSVAACKLFAEGREIPWKII